MSIQFTDSGRYARLVKDGAAQAVKIVNKILEGLGDSL
jgi:hypothetical protein